MDLLCTSCGEPWEMDYVLHEEPEAFERQGAAVVRCPACPKDGSAPKLSRGERVRLAVGRELGALLGDDVDGYAAELEEFLP